MGDVIHVTCVLARGKFEGPFDVKADGLAFVNPAQRNKPWHWIACHEKGTPAIPDIGQVHCPQWEYEVKGNRLYFTPSLLDKSDGFHTDYHWNVAFAELPEGRDPYDFFYEQNPGVREGQG